MRITEAFSHLSPAVARQALHSLLALLPPSVPDTAEERDSRDAAAVEAVASLAPANAIEARLAVQIAGADAHAADCLRLAMRPGNLTAKDSSRLPVLQGRDQGAQPMHADGHGIGIEENSVGCGGQAHALIQDAGWIVFVRWNLNELPGRRALNEFDGTVGRT